MRLVENHENVAAKWAAEEARIRARAHPPELPALPRIPAGRYTDPDFYRLEGERLFAKVWLLAAVANELPEPGSFKTLKLNDKPVVLVRGEDGRIRTFHNVCQHRGACLVRAETGSATSLRCPYHAWNYALDGSVKFIPDEFDFPGLDRGAMALRELRCEQHGNLVFVAFDSTIRPLEDYLGALVDLLGDVPWHEVRLYRTSEFIADCNWKCIHDAFSETYHVQFTHQDTVHQAISRTHTARQMLRGGHNAMVVRNRVGELDNARRNVLDAGSAGPSTMAKRLNPITQTAQRSYNAFPNLTIPVGENLMTILSAWPIAVDKTVVQLRYIKVDCAAEMDTEADRATVDGFNAVLQEDFHAVAGMQEALAGGGIDHLTLGAGERFIYNFHRELDRVIGRDNIPPALRVMDIELPLGDATPVTDVA